MKLVTLAPVTRDNWLTALKLKVAPEQQAFVPEVAVSLAKIAIKPDSPDADYVPFAICDGEVMVGFIMHAYEAGTSDMYWINGFLIDAAYQGQGYGSAALLQMIDYIRDRSPLAECIQLTVNRHNAAAARFYEKHGFASTGTVWDDERVFRLQLAR